MLLVPVAGAARGMNVTCCTDRVKAHNDLPAGSGAGLPLLRHALLLARALIIPIKSYLV